MSRRDWRVLVQDVLDAIAQIDIYVRGMTIEAFEDDSKTVDAVIRNLIVIGEAAAHMPADVVERSPGLPWRLMADMRNFAVHHYWAVDRAILWKTIRDDLPPLAQQLRQMVSTDCGLAP